MISMLAQFHRKLAKYISKRNPFLFRDIYMYTVINLWLHACIVLFYAYNVKDDNLTSLETIFVDHFLFSRGY